MRRSAIYAQESAMRWPSTLNVLVIAGKAPLAQALCDLFEAYGLHAMMLDEGIRKGMGMLGVRTICEAE